MMGSGCAFRFADHLLLRIAKGWAAALGLLVAVGGCHSLPLGAKRVYVDLAALRAAHPAWPLLQSVGVAVPSVTGSAPMVVPRSGLLPPQLPQMAPLPAIPPDRSGGGPVRRRDPVAQLLFTLQARDARTLAREREAIRRRVEADLAGRRAELQARERADLEALEARRAKLAMDRALREIAIRSRIAVLVGPPRQEQEVLLARVRRRADRTERRTAQERTALRGRMAQEYADLRADVEETIERRMMERAAQLRSATREAVAAYRERMRSALQSALPSAAEQQRARRAAVALRVATPAQVLADAGAVWSPIAQSADDAGLAVQRARILREVDADLQRQVRDIARRRGWVVQFEPAPGVEDATSTVKEIVRRAQERL